MEGAYFRNFMAIESFSLWFALICASQRIKLTLFVQRCDNVGTK